MTKIAEFRPEWADAVDQIHVEAFGGVGERDLVRALRAAGDAVVELVAHEGDSVLGHVCFSPLSVEPPTIRIAALAPVAVMPARQGLGIGDTLIRDGLVYCTERGFDAVTVLGDPDYYRRFGFTRGAARALKSVYSGPAYQALSLRDGALEGGAWTVRYPGAFESLD